MKKKLLSLLLVFTMVLTGMVGIASAGDQMNRVNLSVSVDGKAPVTVKAYHASYTYNLYVNMDDFCSALSGTSKQMDIRYDDQQEAWIVTTGIAYADKADVKENTGFDVTYTQDPTAGDDDISLDAPTFYIDGKRNEYRIYSKDGAAYMKLVDLALVFGLTTELTSATTLSVDTKTEYQIDIDALDENGYFTFLHGTVLGNADTGEILYSNKADSVTQIASTSKLMSYLLVQEAIERGDLSLDTKVKLSANVIEEANSEDSTSTFRNSFKLGQEVSVHDLIAGMLLPSANECATALAEAVSGSEAEFVKLMNKRAAELGMKDAKFYNPHGLPNYDPSSITAKRQNSMTANDMFTLVTYLLNNYEEEMTYFTSKTSIDIPTVGAGAKANCTYSTLIYNMGVSGLKTGTTNRSGACIVTVLPVQNNSETQNLVSVLFGTENNMERYEKSMMLLRYGQQYYAEKNAGQSAFTNGSYYADAVTWAVNNDLAESTSAFTFHPDAACTRAQIVSFLWRAAGSPAPKSTAAFTDVSTDAYYADAVAWAVENGITSGTSTATFGPDESCTRAQAMTFLYKAHGEAVTTVSAFTDVADGAYYADAVNWAVANGITSGIGGGLFGVDDTCTRAQIITFLYGLLGK